MSNKGTGAKKPATAKATAPATTTATDDALKPAELNEQDNPTALKLQEQQEEVAKNRDINTDNKASDKDLPKTPALKKNDKVDADEVGHPENKVRHEVSGKLEYETAADFQESLKKK